MEEDDEGFALLAFPVDLLNRIKKPNLLFLGASWSEFSDEVGRDTWCGDGGELGLSLDELALL